MGSEEQKERARVKRRNMIAKNMLEQRRQFGERRIKDKKKETKPFNKHKAMKTNVEEDDFGCRNYDRCFYPDCGCSDD